MLNPLVMPDSEAQTTAFEDRRHFGRLHTWIVGLFSLLQQDGAASGLDGQLRQRRLADGSTGLAATAYVAHGDAGEAGVDGAAGCVGIQAKGAALRQRQAQFAVAILKSGAPAAVQRSMKVNRAALRLHP